MRDLLLKSASFLLFSCLLSVLPHRTEPVGLSLPVHHGEALVASQCACPLRGKDLTRGRPRNPLGFFERQRNRIFIAKQIITSRIYSTLPTPPPLRKHLQCGSTEGGAYGHLMSHFPLFFCLPPPDSSFLKVGRF